MGKILAYLRGYRTGLTQEGVKPGLDKMAVASESGGELRRQRPERSIGYF